ncbi:MAG: 2-phosphosulfolactate phosphatase [Nitriliruptoraceae bacterium]
MVRYVDLAQAEPDQAVVVIDVLRAFTVQPWLLHRGAGRLLTVAEADTAFALREHWLPDALLVGEEGSRPIPGFDHGNSPTEVAALTSLEGRAVIHRTSAGTQGLARTVGSDLVLAASLVTAAATARALREAEVSDVTFVITGASLGRDGDEDLAAAELIAARLVGDDPDPRPYLDRVAACDAARMFAPGGPSWAPVSDLEHAMQVDAFDHALYVTASDLPDALEVHTA